MRKTVLHIAVIFLMAGTAFLVFRPALGGGYVFDDYDEVLDNPAVKQGLWDAVSKKPFRAITAATYRADYLVGRGNPETFHRSNIVLHVIAGFMLMVFCVKSMIWAGKKENIAVFAGILAGAVFLIHPIVIEPVSYISARGNILAGIFIFAAFWLVLKTFENGFSIFWHVLGLGAILAALFCNEAAIGGAFAAMILTGLNAIVYSDRRDISVGRKEAGQECPAYRDLTGLLSKHWRFYAAILAPHIAVVSVWIILRFQHRIILGAMVSGNAVERSWFTPFWAIGTYARLMLFPVGLSLDHGSGSATVIGAVLYSLFGMIVVFSVLPIFVSLRRKLSESAVLSLFLWVWWVFSLAVSVALPLADAVAERRAYIAAGAFACALVFVIVHLAGKSGKYLKISASMGGAIAVLFFAISASDARVWRNPVELWTANVKNNPSSARTRAWLGKSLLDAGRVRSARMALENAVLNATKLARPEADLGVAFAMEGDLAAAEYHFDSAIRKDPSDWRAYADYGVLETQKGNYQKAESLLKTALSMEPDHSTLWFNIGNTYRAWGKTAQAVDAFQKAIKLDPERFGARTNLAIALADAGDSESGWREITETLRLSPDYAPALSFASQLAYRRGNVELSVEYLTKYLRIKPDDYDAWINLSKLFNQLGRDAEARGALEKASGIKPPDKAP